jgi:hypothetical protein
MNCLRSTGVNLAYEPSADRPHEGVLSVSAPTDGFDPNDYDRRLVGRLYDEMD